MHQSQRTYLSVDRPLGAKVSPFFPLCDRPVSTRESEPRPELRAVKREWQNCSTIGSKRYGRAGLRGDRTDEGQVFLKNWKEMKQNCHIDVRG
jgi:hypothetical protein